MCLRSLLRSLGLSSQNIHKPLRCCCLDYCLLKMLLGLHSHNHIPEKTCKRLLKMVHLGYLSRPIVGHCSRVLCRGFVCPLTHYKLCLCLNCLLFVHKNYTHTIRYQCLLLGCNCLRLN